MDARVGKKQSKKGERKTPEGRKRTQKAKDEWSGQREERKRV